MVRAVVALGSNLGDRECCMQMAVDRLRSFIDRMEASSLYESDAMYVESQGSFLNAVVVGEVGIGPIEMLSLLKDIEADLGRVDRGRFGPREVDLDLVDYGGLRYFSEELILPHERAWERRFVLEPWAEIEPGASCVPYGSVSERLLCDEIRSQGVRIVRDASLSV